MLGTIDHFGMAFQYQINFFILKNGQKQSQSKNTINKCIKANISALWQHNYAVLYHQLKYSSPNCSKKKKKKKKARAYLLENGGL